MPRCQRGDSTASKRCVFFSKFWDWRDLDSLKIPANSSYEIILQCPGFRKVKHRDYEEYQEYYNFNDRFMQLIESPEEGWKHQEEYHYRLKQPNHGGYFIVSIAPFRDNTLSLLTWTTEFNEAAYKQAMVEIDEPSVPIVVETLDPADHLVRTWQHVLLLRIKKSNKIMAIDPDFYGIGTWRVYVPKGDGTLERCVVKFRDDHKANGLNLFPNGAFKDLCKLLDKAIGVPHGWQGTLDPIGTLRFRVNFTITNAAIRPWVIIDSGESHCNNSTLAVEEGLKQWSRKHPEYALQYRQIKQLYPKAEQDLALYYQNYLRLDLDTAKHYAKYILDIIYRAHFRFYSLSI